MSDLITLHVPESSNITCLENSEKVGKYLYKHNENYRIIANCMEHPQFRELFDKHFSSWDKVKNILMFLKLYQEIEKSSPVELNGYQKLAILDNIMKDKELRHDICQEVNNMTRNIKYLE